MTSSFYEIDQNDRIIIVGGHWDEFANNNEGEAATLTSILGTTLWDHVEGFDTAIYLAKIFDACRSLDGSLSMLYRCDSPEQERLFRMAVSKTQNGNIQVLHDLVSLGNSMQTNKVVNLGAVYSADKCSICCAFKVEDSWVNPFCVPNAKFFPRGMTVCPSCNKQSELQFRQMSQSSA